MGSSIALSPDINNTTTTISNNVPLIPESVPLQTDEIHYMKQHAFSKSKKPKVSESWRSSSQSRLSASQLPEPNSIVKSPGPQPAEMSFGKLALNNETMNQSKPEQTVSQKPHPSTQTQQLLNKSKSEQLYPKFIAKSRVQDKQTPRTNQQKPGGIALSSQVPESKSNQGSVLSKPRSIPKPRLPANQKEQSQLLAAILKTTQMIKSTKNNKNNKKASKFEIATSSQVSLYFNKNIKEIKVPVKLQKYLNNPSYENKFQMYTIQRAQLPLPCQLLPEQWLYTGQWHNGLPHGIGKIYHTGFIYEGYVHSGVPHIKGRLSTTDDIYEGEFNMFARDGMGQIVTRKGYYFQGNYVKDKRQGEGYEIHRNGIVFDGLYENDKVKSGRLYMPNIEVRTQLNKISHKEYKQQAINSYKEMYEGNFQNGNYEGYGEYYFSDGRHYNGEWKEGSMHGQGVFCWPNGKRYEGEYRKGKREGFGRFQTRCKIYEGYWLRGKPHGKGNIVMGDIVKEHLWHMGRIVRQGSRSVSDAASMVSDELERYPSEDVASLHFDFQKSQFKG